MERPPKLTPFIKFLRGLEAAQLDFNETMMEMRAFAEVLARKTNSLEMDEDGTFYATSFGTVEEIIPIIYKQLDKLERIQKQKDGSKS